MVGVFFSVHDALWSPPNWYETALRNIHPELFEHERWRIPDFGSMIDALWIYVNRAMHEALQLPKHLVLWGWSCFSIETLPPNVIYHVLSLSAIWLPTQICFRGSGYCTVCTRLGIIIVLLVTIGYFQSNLRYEVYSREEPRATAGANEAPSYTPLTAQATPFETTWEYFVDTTQIPAELTNAGLNYFHDRVKHIGNQQEKITEEVADELKKNLYTAGFFQLWTSPTFWAWFLSCMGSGIVVIQSIAHFLYQQGGPQGEAARGNVRQAAAQNMARMRGWFNGIWASMANAGAGGAAAVRGWFNSAANWMRAQQVARAVGAGVGAVGGGAMGNAAAGGDAPVFTPAQQAEMEEQVRNMVGQQYRQVGLGAVGLQRAAGMARDGDVNIFGGL